MTSNLSGYERTAPGLVHAELRLHVVSDPKFWNSVRVSFTFTIASMVLSVSIGLTLALISNQAVRFRSTFRTIALMPWVTSYVVTYLIFRWILNADYGLLNALFVEV